MSILRKIIAFWEPEVWEYGTCNKKAARRHKYKKNVQFVLWEKHDQMNVDGIGHLTHKWHDFESSWWDTFVKVDGFFCVYIVKEYIMERTLLRDVGLLGHIEDLFLKLHQTYFKEIHFILIYKTLSEAEVVTHWCIYKNLADYYCRKINLQRTVKDIDIPLLNRIFSQYLDESNIKTNAK